jgi:hypothetical protein
LGAEYKWKRDGRPSDGGDEQPGTSSVLGWAAAKSGQASGGIQAGDHAHLKPKQDPDVY